MMPSSRLVGFAELALATGKTITSLSTAASRGKLPLVVHRVGHIVTFDAAEVAAWVEAGCPTVADWKKIQPVPKGDALHGALTTASNTEPDFSRAGHSPA